MKERTFEAQIIAATPHSDKTNSFVKDTMHKINQQSLSGRLPVNKRRSFAAWVKHLHKPAIALAAFGAVLLFGGVVYAAVHFAPMLIQMLGKETNSRGATEYAFSGFKDCSKNVDNVAGRFEIKSDADGITDEDVQKIIQAKCEMAWVNDFIASTWPREGTDASLKEGDRLYYTRVDVMGKVEKLNDTSYTVLMDGGEVSSHQVFSGEKIKAYLGSTEIPLSSVHRGEPVFTIVRASEVFHGYRNCFSNPESTNTNPCPTDNNMKVEGAIAVFKMSLPEKYYGSMQNLVTEIPECVGNAGEFCAHTPSIDIYPRTGGEGVNNPYYRNIADGVSREITGTVTELKDNTLTLKSRKGSLYTITVGDAGFKVYNRDYTSAYTDVDAHLKVGSNVTVRYHQPKNADVKNITKEQVQMVVLQLEGINPKKSVNPY